MFTVSKRNLSATLFITPCAFPPFSRFFISLVGRHYLEPYEKTVIKLRRNVNDTREGIDVILRAHQTAYRRLHALFEGVKGILMSDNDFWSKLSKRICTLNHK